MSEYQRYEFMTADRPLTRTELDAVKALSSHIEASSTHALIEYHWGDFKHNPIKVLHKYFDGFLYWANWGSPQLGLRFPHGMLPADLIKGYDFDDLVTFTQYPDYDILDIHFGEMEGPDEWADYELGSLMPIREELMGGDLRALYIAWLASQPAMGRGRDDDDEDEDDEDYEDEDYEEDDEDEDEDKDEIISAPAVPPNFGMLTEAQEALADLLQVPVELLAAASEYSKEDTSSTEDDFDAWVELLPQDRRSDYLVRLADNEPGLSRLLVKELRELGEGATTTPSTGEQVTYATLLTESRAIKTQMERKRREQEQLARQRHLQEIHDHQETYWRQVEQAVSRGTSTGYDEGLKLLIELRDAAEQFKETQEFQTRFSTWIRSHLRRPAFLKRLQGRKFTVPQA